jgi:hypothetical protein
VLTAYSVHGVSHTDCLPSVCADGVFRTGASHTQTASLREGLCVLTAYSVYGVSHTDSLPSVCADSVYSGVFPYYPLQWRLRRSSFVLYGQRTVPLVQRKDM